LSLEPVPAERRRRIGYVDGEGQDRRRALRRQRAVEPVDDGGVAVERDDITGVLRSDTRVSSFVTADVPHDATAGRTPDRPDEGPLAGGAAFVAGGRRAVVGPGRRARLPLELADELLQPAHVRDDQLLAKAGLLELRLHVAARVGVLALEACVERDVREHASAQ